MSARNIAVFINAYAYVKKGKYYFERSSLTSFFIGLAEFYSSVTIYQYYKPRLDGHEIQLALPSTANIDFRLIQLQRRGVFRAANIFSVLRQLRGLENAVKNHDEFMVIGFSVFGTIMATWAWVLKKPFMFYIRGDAQANNYFEFAGGRRNWVFYRLITLFHGFNRFLMKRARVISVCGEVLREKFRQLNQNVFSITPLLPDYFRLAETPSTKFQRDDTFVILYVGWLLQRKGIYELVAAVKMLHDCVSMPVKLIMVGEGQECSKLHTFIEKEALGDYIEITGAVSNIEIIKFYDMADVLVLPSYTEGTPRVIAESFSRRLPVIATRVGSIPFMIDDYENGILINPGDSEDLFQALQYLLENPEKLQAMRECALQQADHFMIVEQSQKFITIINKLTNADRFVRDES